GQGSRVAQAPLRRQPSSPAAVSLWEQKPLINISPRSEGHKTCVLENEVCSWMLVLIGMPRSQSLFVQNHATLRSPSQYANGTWLADPRRISTNIFFRFICVLAHRRHCLRSPNLLI